LLTLENANRKLLSLVPHKKILDLAMVYYCILGEIEDGNATALIYNSNIKNCKDYCTKDHPMNIFPLLYQHIL